MSHRLSPILGVVAACALLLAGCGASPTANEATPAKPTRESVSTPQESTPESVAASTDAPPPATENSPPAVDTTEAEPEPAVQEESCDWDNEPSPAGSAGDAPSAPGESELASVLVGAWQHTHIDSGAGFEPLDAATDIRFVFPSTSRLLYCQDIAGILPEAENPSGIELLGTDIVLPGDAPGYTVIGWDQDAMVWKNNLDGSLYLVKRR